MIGRVHAQDISAMGLLMPGKLASVGFHEARPRLGVAALPVERRGAGQADEDLEIRPVLSFLRHHPVETPQGVDIRRRGGELRERVEDRHRSRIELVRALQGGRRLSHISELQQGIAKAVRGVRMERREAQDRAIRFRRAGIVSVLTMQLCQGQMDPRIVRPEPPRLFQNRCRRLACTQPEIGGAEVAHRPDQHRRVVPVGILLPDGALLDRLGRDRRRRGAHRGEGPGDPARPGPPGHPRRPQPG